MTSSPLRPFDVGPSPSTPYLQRRRGRTSTSPMLMQWQYRLSHLTFAKLKQLTLNGEIPKKLAKIMLPKCTGCILGVMTKIPWRSKETKASHEVFIATKPGECPKPDSSRK